ncbi:MAG TPA: hypothetical protein VFW27_15490 [Actinoplanes sp.]|nr:hypothetical protein [Actinoplanes sp.]
MGDGTRATSRGSVSAGAPWAAAIWLNLGMQNAKVAGSWPIGISFRMSAAPPLSRSADPLSTSRFPASFRVET